MDRVPVGVEEMVERAEVGNMNRMIRVPLTLPSLHWMGRGDDEEWSRFTENSPVKQTGGGLTWQCLCRNFCC